MRLDYRILWIEDDKTWLKPIKKEVSSHISQKGYRPTIDAPDTINDSMMKENNYFKNYDIIFIDYALKGLSQEDGDSLIEKIRNKQVYANIVFYSSNLTKIKDETKEKKLNGVYIYERTEFELDNIDDILELIDFFLEKDMDINSMRGIAMSEVAKFDALIWEMLTNEDCRVHVAEKIKKQKENNHNGVKNKTDDELWEQVEQKGTIVLDSISRKDILHSKILKDKYNGHLEASDLYQYYVKIGEYQENILAKRNTLAHHISPSMPIDDLIEFRKQLIAFGDLFSNLKDELCKKP